MKKIIILLAVAFSACKVTKPIKQQDSNPKFSTNVTYSSYDGAIYASPRYELKYNGRILWSNHELAIYLDDLDSVNNLAYRQADTISMREVHKHPEK